MDTACMEINIIMLMIFELIKIVQFLNVKEETQEVANLFWASGMFF